MVSAQQLRGIPSAQQDGDSGAQQTMDFKATVGIGFQRGTDTDDFKCSAGSAFQVCDFRCTCLGFHCRRIRELKPQKEMDGWMDGIRVFRFLGGFFVSIVKKDSKHRKGGPATRSKDHKLTLVRLLSLVTSEYIILLTCLQYPPTLPLQIGP